MPKFVTPAALSAIKQRTPVSSCVIVSVLWGFDLQWYSSKNISINGIDVQARVIEVGQMSNQKRADNRSTTGDMSVTLDDSDGRLKFYIDNTVAEKTEAQIWLWFDGTGFDDRMLLLSGHMKEPQWEDQGRKVSFTIETVIEKQEFGFAPTRDDFKDLSDDAVGIAWPAAFGTVKHLPTIHAKKPIQATLTVDIRLSGQGYYRQGNILREDTQPKIQSYINSAYTADVIYIDRPEIFPQNKPIVLSINNVYFLGQFAPDGSFKVEQANYPKYQNLKVTASQPNIGTTGITTSGKYNVNVDVGDSKISLANCFCYFEGGGFSYCEEQIGTICYFSYPFIGKDGRSFTPNLIQFVYSIAENGMTHAKELERLFHTFNFAQSQVTVPLAAYHELLSSASQASNALWRIETGATVFLYDPDEINIYVASAIRMSSITSVYGKKLIKTYTGKQRRIFTTIPAEYYQIQLTSNIPINDEFVSGLIVPVRLSELIGQEWDDDIYVSGTSTQGPNSVEIIRYILEQFTDLDLDASFDNVSSDVAPYPCNFAYFDRKNALQFAQEIAWQSRCVLVVDAERVSIRYLGQAPNPIMIFNTSNVAEDSVKLSWTSVDEIVTRFDATWTDTYKDSPSVQNLNTSEVNRLSRVLKALVPDTYKERTATKLYQYRENIDVFGLMQEQANIFIYNDEPSVKKTVDFWGHRKANSWQKVVFRALNLDALILQPFDGIAINLNQSPILLNVIGTVERIEYSHQNRMVEIEAWLPILAGTQTVDSKAYG